MSQAPSVSIEAVTGPGVNLLKSFNLALRAMNRSPEGQRVFFRPVLGGRYSASCKFGDTVRLIHKASDADTDGNQDL